MGLKRQGFSILSVLVNEGPAIFGLPIRKCEKTVLQKVLGSLRRLARLKIGRACDELMPICQNLPGDERRIFQLAKSKSRVHAFGDEIHQAFGDENLHAYVRVGSLKGADERRQ